MREIFAIESFTEERSEDRLKSHGKMLKSGKLRFGSGEKGFPSFCEVDWQFTFGFVSYLTTEVYFIMRSRFG